MEYDFKKYDDCLGFINDNMPIAIKNTKGSLQCPFVSQNAHREVIAALALSLYAELNNLPKK